VFGAVQLNQTKSTTEVSIHVTTKNNNKYSLKDAFTLKITGVVQGSLEPWLSGTFDETFTVYTYQFIQCMLLEQRYQND